MTKSQGPSGNKNGIKVIQWDKPTTITQEEAEARLHQEGYECFCWFDVPGTSYPRHKHETDECLWILNGEIHFTIENDTYILHRGDKIYLPANIPHTAQVPLSQSVTYLVGKKKN